MEHEVEEQQVKISYHAKNSTNCPVCGASFRKEEMLSGGGRLIAKDTTDELRRIYQPSKKAGEIYPLIYSVTVCPECLYAAYPEDFLHIKTEHISAAFSQMRKRRKDMALIFPALDFTAPRDLFTGTASYLLSIGCYAFHSKERAPTFKKALSSLRGAWLFENLDKKYQNQNYDKLKLIMYEKAIMYYEKTIKYAQTGEERVDAIKNFGPDLDKNYGFPGVLFIWTLLQFKYGNGSVKEERIRTLQASRRVVSRIFGMGKSSKDKPMLILDRAKDLYERIGEKIAELKEQ